MIAEALQKKTEVEVQRRQIDSQPLRTLGDYKIAIRLTVDLIPHVKVIVHREGEALPTEETGAPAKAPEKAPVEAPVAAPVEELVETPAEAESSAE
jgi:large subunit ribosomal protein L9